MANTPLTPTTAALSRADKNAATRAVDRNINADSEALNNRANQCKTEGRLSEAETLYRHAIRIRPNNFEALNNLGNLLKATQHPDEAEACLRAALACRPDHPDIRSNLGVLLHEQRRFAAAEVHFRAVLIDFPQHLETLNNLGNLLKDLRRQEEAEACYRRLLADHPTHPEARWNLALLRLLRGDFEEGWPLYEARHDPRRQNREVTLPALPSSHWQGETLNGRHIIVWHEQGHGDEIQFARYFPYLKSEFGASQITVVSKPALQSLFSSIAAVDRVIPAGMTIPPHDYWILCGSLPLRFATTKHALPACLPYLSIPPVQGQDWCGRLPANGKLRVGFSWAGSDLHKNNHNRSLPTPALLAPLWQVTGIDFFSLQTDMQNTLPAKQPCIDCGPLLKDFASSAALLGEMDLLITVDSALAHLAGALGKPCWVLLPWLGIDWRWGESGEHSAWYPGVLRLFRQESSDNWTTIILKVAEQLASWAKSRRIQHDFLNTLPRNDLQRIECMIDRLLMVHNHRKMI